MKTRLRNSGAGDGFPGVYEKSFSHASPHKKSKTSVFGAGSNGGSEVWIVDPARSFTHIAILTTPFDASRQTTSSAIYSSEIGLLLREIHASGFTLMTLLQ